MEWLRYLALAVACCSLGAASASLFYLNRSRRQLDRLAALLAADAERIERQVEEARVSIQRGARRADHRFKLPTKSTDFI